MGMLFLLAFSFTNPTFANEDDYSSQFDEYGIKTGVTLSAEEIERSSQAVNVLSTDSLWETLPAKSDVHLNKDWTISFNRSFTINDIDGIVIEGEGLFLPVKVRLFPTAKQVNITPQESYLPSEKYTVKVFLNNGKRYKMDFITNDIPTISSKYGNTTGNVSNAGLVAEENGWIYYANSSDDYKLYKMKTDGTQKTKLNDTKTSQINVLGGWIYYRDYGIYGYLYKVRIDGTGNAFLEDSNARNISVTDDGWIYYTDNSYMYKVRFDGSDDKMVGYFTKYAYPVIVDGFIYASLEGDRKLYKHNLSTDNSVALTNERVSHINVVDKWIYYINIDDNRIYKMKTDGTNRMKVNDSWTEGLNVSNGWAYYVNSEDRSIYRIQLDGTNEQRLNDTPSTNINVISNWIYYEDPTNEKYYRMHLDGGNWQEVR